MFIRRTQGEINKVLHWAMDTGDGDHYTCANFENGVLQMYYWLIGETELAPDSMLQPDDED